MKIYGKYLVLAKVLSADKPRVASSFMTKKEATAALNKAFGPDENKVWTDRLGQSFWIEFNAKEYK